jgi:heat-inducible transcriptional repressor
VARLPRGLDVRTVRASHPATRSVGRFGNIDDQARIKPDFVVSAELSSRAQSVLCAVVSEFIASGEPVGSRTLAKKYGFDLSAATIRNVLADLEDAGYLEQPHTSAGRVPTPAAFRLFIDALMRMRELSGAETGRIAKWLAELEPGVDIRRETARLLSDLTGTAAVLARPRPETRTLLKLQLIPIRGRELLSVIVMSDGSVLNRYVSLDRPLSAAELERLHNMLETAVEGRTLGGIREYFAESLAQHRDELNSLRRLGVSLVEAALGAAQVRTDLVIEGQVRLLDRPEFSSGDRMRELVRALDDRERLVGLLDRILAASNVQVFLGEEVSVGHGLPVSLVAAPYRDEQGNPGGAVGVLGPTRMDYPTVVPLVGAMARAMSGALARSGRLGTGKGPKKE